jgi:predicted transcriptional regulator
LEPFTIEIDVSELPESVASRLPKQLSRAARVALTVEAVESEAEKFESLRRDLRAGLDDLDAGRTSEAASVFARLKERFAAE